MRMFQMGLEGRQAGGRASAACSRNGSTRATASTVVPPGAPFRSPDFALDGGEEPEIVGIYVIGPDGTPCALGFALGNEFSDHVTERQNYLWLAHSKLAAVPRSGRRLLIGDAAGRRARRRRGSARRRGHLGKAVPVGRGQHVATPSPTSSTITSSIALFRRPGDVHVHFFGTATLSFSDGVKTEPGDVFEIEAKPFTLPLSNSYAVAPHPIPAVKAL